VRIHDFRFLLLAALCAATALVYLPGLRSGFLLDDAYNLLLLERIPAEGYASYVFSGTAGPGGRPLSLLSFALQHGSWPHAPLHFKLVNLAIHLLGGVLVFLIAGGVARLRGAAPAWAAGMALLASGWWLLHPMQMSTVLYVVQRMAQISALFILLGVLGYLLGRELCGRGRLRAGYVLMTVSVLGGTLLAITGKENGVLLPLLVLVVDCTLLQSLAKPPGYRSWRRLLLVLPSALLALYFAWTLPNASRAFAELSYSIWQKTLTEAIVLMQYLFDILLPRPAAFGLYHDDFPVAAGLLDPPWTLFAATAIVGLVAAAIAFRRRYPVAALGVLWFFGGHLLESTHFNLSIYFEHRNYLPTAGLFVAMSWMAAQFLAGRPARRLWLGAALAYTVLVVGVTAQNSFLWGNRLLQTSEAVRMHPGSVWAWEDFGGQLLAAGRTTEALRMYQDMERLHPALAYPRLRQMAIHGCVLNAGMAEDWWRAMLESAAESKPAGSEVLGELDRVISTIQAGECTGVDSARLRDWIELLARNPAFRRQRGALLELAAHLSLHRNEPLRALEELSGAVRASPTPNRQLQLVELQLALGLLEDAETSLERLEGELRRSPIGQLGHGARVAELRRRLDGLKGGSGGSGGTA
jgi:hypothetical protein